jgi:hypothetical protein
MGEQPMSTLVGDPDNGPEKSIDRETFNKFMEEMNEMLERAANNGKHEGTSR